MVEPVAVVECTPDIIGPAEVIQCMQRWSRARLDRLVSRSVEEVTVETDSLGTGDKETPGEDAAGDREETGVGTM